MILVYLSDDEEKRASEIGLRRHNEAKAAGYKDKREPLPDEVSIANHIIGAKGELAAAHALGKEWEGRVGNFEEADIGKRTQVRTRRGYKSKLIVRPENSDKDFFVLVTHEEKNPKLFCVIGWIKGRAAKTIPTENPRGIHPAHFVPQEMLHQF